MNDLFYYFLYCLQPAIRNKIQIFSLDSDHDLDDTIFQAIIQGIISEEKQNLIDFFLNSKTNEEFRK